MERELFEKKYQEASTVRDPLFVQKVQQFYGRLEKEIKLIACIEELAELLQALSKYYRQKGDRLTLIEEMGDSVFCVEILRQGYGIAEKELETAFFCARRSVMSAQQLQDSDKKSSIALYMREVSKRMQFLSEGFIEDFSQKQMILILGSLLVCAGSLCQYFGITEGELNKAINVKIGKASLNSH